MAVFLQSGAYGMTFVLPELFQTFGANEKAVGSMLIISAIVTIISVYFSGYLSDYFGIFTTLALACVAIVLAMVLYATAFNIGLGLIIASVALGFGWGVTYSLAPIVLTKLVAPHERIRFFAILSVSLMAGFGLSPVIASVLMSHSFDIRLAFYITAVLAFISAVIFYMLGLKIDLKSTSSNSLNQVKSNLNFANILQITKTPALLPIIMVCLGASVFAGMNNFQTVFAAEKGVNYAIYFAVYTSTVVFFRIVLASVNGGKSPYLMIAGLQFIMCFSVILLSYITNSTSLYVVVAVLFGIGYGASYPILAVMAANDADQKLLPQTLQLFALTYFAGIFGFPLIAGWIIVEFGSTVLLTFVALLAFLEASLALYRASKQKIKTT